MNTPLNKWHYRYLELAEQVATWSKDPSTKVGSVIIDQKGRPVSFGFNGFPRGMIDSGERLEDRTFKLSHVIHAESNAILSANRSLDDCTIYVTHPPCAHCLGQIRQSFISNVVCYDVDEKFKKNWNTEHVVKMAQELNINLTILKRDTL